MGYFGPLFGALFQLRPAPFTTYLIQATTGVVLQLVLAGLAKPAQRPEKGGQKRGPKLEVLFEPWLTKKGFNIYKESHVNRSKIA